MLPLSFYIVAKVLKKDQISMPRYYNPERIDSSMSGGVKTYDTTFIRVPELTLVNQMGDTVSVNKSLEGKIVVVNLFFTQCGSICPRLTGNIGLLQKAFRKNDTTVQLVSISVDPARDSFKALQQYAAAHNVDNDHWWLLTGDRTAIYNYARNYLKLLATPADGGVEELTHSQMLVLLDRERFVRGYYDGLDSLSIKQCADDIVLLSLEKKRKHK